MSAENIFSRTLMRFRKKTKSRTFDKPTASVISLVPKVEIKLVNTLRITFKDNTWISYTVDAKGDVSNDPVQPWKEFHDWYETNKVDYYIFKYYRGSRMLLRSDIKNFSCEISEKEPENLT